MKKVFILLFAVLLLAGCVSMPPETTPPTTEAAPPSTAQPTEPTLRFPDAPKAQPVEALTGEITLDRLVESCWSQELRLPDGTVCYVSIPRITSFSQEAAECQRAIYELFRQYLQKTLEAAPEVTAAPWDSALSPDALSRLPLEKEVRYYTYSAAYRNGVLSILVRADGYPGSDMPYPPSEPYSVYNLPVTEDCVLPDPLMDSVSWTLESYYLSTYLPEASDSAGDYHTGMRRTLQNCKNAVAFYGEGGRLCVLGSVCPPGSSKPVQQILPVVSKPGGYMPLAEITRNYNRSWWTTFIYEGALYDHDTASGVTTVVHPGPVKLQIRTRDHWYYTLEEDPGTVRRKDRATQTEEVLLSIPGSVVTDLAFFGYEYDGSLMIVCDETEITLLEIPGLTCTAVEYSGNLPIKKIEDITKESTVLSFRFVTADGSYHTYSVTEGKLIGS